MTEVSSKEQDVVIMEKNIVVSNVDGSRICFDEISDKQPVIRVGHKFICAYCNTKDLTLSSIYKHISECGLSEENQVSRRVKNRMSLEVGQMMRKSKISREEATEIYTNKFLSQNVAILEAHSTATKNMVSAATRKRYGDAVKIAAAKNAAAKFAAISKKRNTLPNNNKKPLAKDAAVKIAAVKFADAKNAAAKNAAISKKRNTLPNNIKKPLSIAAKICASRGKRSHFIFNHESSQHNNMFPDKCASLDKVSSLEMFQSNSGIYADLSHKAYDIPIINMPVFWKFSPFFVDSDTCLKLSPGKFVTMKCFLS